MSANRDEKPVKGFRASLPNIVRRLLEAFFLGRCALGFLSEICIIPFLFVLVFYQVGGVVVLWVLMSSKSMRDSGMKEGARLGAV